jgi:hypothetical protein
LHDRLKKISHDSKCLRWDKNKALSKHKLCTLQLS